MANKMGPFVKWAGGKGQLVDRLIDRMPPQYNNYFEPFVGGGAMFWSVAPEHGYINDINAELIHTYKVIRDNATELIEHLVAFDSVECTKEFYYAQRESYNKKISQKIYDTETAALFIFLNKHCFNGLYRVNGKGLFNVPWNQKTHVDSFSSENIFSISQFLKNAVIACGDFETALTDAKSEDFIFIDSPYAPINPTSFESYTKEGFSESEHRRLASLFKELTARGCYCMLTNHNTDLIQELYQDFLIEEVDVRRNINSKATNRTGKEVIIRNY